MIIVRNMIIMIAVIVFWGAPWRTANWFDGCSRIFAKLSRCPWNSSGLFRLGRVGD